MGLSKIKSDRNAICIFNSCSKKSKDDKMGLRKKTVSVCIQEGRGSSTCSLDTICQAKHYLRLLTPGAPAPASHPV